MVTPRVTEAGMPSVAQREAFVASKVAGMQRKVAARVKAEMAPAHGRQVERVRASLLVKGTHEAKGAKVAPYRSANGGW